MKLRMATTLALLALILSSAACSAAGGSAPPSPTPGPGTWRIIPTSLKVEPAADGGQHVTIDLAFENGTDEFSAQEWDAQGCAIMGQDGESYSVTAFDPAQSQPGGTYAIQTGGERSTVGVIYHALPPGFRTRGIRHVMIEQPGIVIHLTDSRYQLLADIGQDTQPVKVMLPDYGELDLGQDTVDLAFPEEARGSSAYKVGDTVEVPGKAKLTVLSVARETFEHVGDFGEFDRVTADIRYENLSDSYDNTFRVQYSLIGDDGFFYEVLSDTMAWNPSPRLEARAGETVTTGVWYAVPRATKNLHLVLAGSVRAVFDTGL